MLDSQAEIRAGKRFAFGANWDSFVRLVDEERTATAMRSLTDALRMESLAGRSFLDVGCGSGLFSLAAVRLGARVRSLDYDADSVSAAAGLQRRFAPDSDWTIEAGSILDPAYTARLGQHDIVYAWGVLHHTGQMWQALAATTDLVAPGGRLFVSIYNDQGFASRVWRRVKRRYNRSGLAGRTILLALSTLYLGRRWPMRALARLARPTNGRRPTIRTRGMSRRHDMTDWVGGYPFEVARPEDVFGFVNGRGFELRHLTTCGGGLGCNEYVFERITSDRSGRTVTPE